MRRQECRHPRHLVECAVGYHGNISQLSNSVWMAAMCHSARQEKSESAMINAIKGSCQSRARIPFLRRSIGVLEQPWFDLSVLPYRTSLAPYFFLLSPSFPTGVASLDWRSPTTACHGPQYPPPPPKQSIAPSLIMQRKRSQKKVLHWLYRQTRTGAKTPG
jgi:hypothetical protein